MDASSAPGDLDLSGRRLVFLLFLVLWIVTLVTLVGFGIWTTQRFDVGTSRRIWVALVANLMLPVIAWQVFRLMNEYRAKRA